jgi:hypothetical protein
MKAIPPAGSRVNAPTHLFAQTTPVEGVVGIVGRLRLEDDVVVFRVSFQPNSLLVGTEARDLVKELGSSNGGVGPVSRLEDADAHFAAA